MSLLLHIYMVGVLLAIFPLWFMLAWEEEFNIKTGAQALLGAAVWPLWPLAMLGTWLWDRRASR
jgi:hypothetical protein